MAISKLDKISKLVRDYKEVFGSTTGRKVLNDLVITSGLLDESFCRNAGEMAYKSGKKSLVLYILSRLDTDPDALRQIMSESLEQDEDNYV